MNSFFNFFREVRSELAKVIWPSRKDTVWYTVTVIVFSLVVAAILGLADYGFLRLFEKLLVK